MTQYFTLQTTTPNLATLRMNEKVAQSRSGVGNADYSCDVTLHRLGQPQDCRTQRSAFIGP